MDEAKQATLQDAGLLVLRVGTGLLMLAGHGFGKLISFSEASATFPDPLGVGPVVSMALAIGAEFFCSLLIVVGLFTRFAAVPLLITMLVAALVVHADDPWQRKELAVVYLVPFVCLLLSGAGRFSLDAAMLRRLKR
ncbi:MAG: DoxX family protein [Bdellovibrionales bacterium]|nr:DoxX family protein [Bdellovibrionales bacterium]